MVVRSLAVMLAVVGCGRIGFDPNEPLGDSGQTGDGGNGTQLNRAFVTAVAYAVPFAGTAAADAICQQAADAAQLGGAFIALLGDDATPPLTRLGAARGWADVTGAIVVDQASEWLDGTMRRPLHRDANGNSLGLQTIWLGARATYTCASWTSTTTPQVSVVYTLNPFDEFTVASCAGTFHFACVETAKQVPASEPVQSGRVAFVSTAVNNASSGLLGADNLCAGQANANGLIGSFKALRATSSIAALSRFSLTGPPWVRVDGIPFTTAASDFATEPLLASFLLKADGMPATDAPNFWAWIGDAANNCVDWSSNGINAYALVGDAASAERMAFLARAIVSCNVFRPTICLQE